MNYLAHVYLADRVGSSITGNLMGDFVHGRLPGRFPLPIERGLRLHRRVDRVTDSHPVPRTSRRRFSPPFRRYAGILVDLFYDHCLARDWPEYHEEPLATFTAHVYADLEAHEGLLVEPLRTAYLHMQHNDLLASYARLGNLENALVHLHRRLSRANPLARGLEPLGLYYDKLSSDFREFMPELVEATSAQWEKIRKNIPETGL